MQSVAPASSAWEKASRASALMPASLSPVSKCLLLAFFYDDSYGAVSLGACSPSCKMSTRNEEKEKR